MSADWTLFNAEGLRLADQGRWVDAIGAFELAVAEVTGIDTDNTVTGVAHDAIRARLLLNLGQCHFHTGAFAESRRLAERSCALRVSLYGEDSLMVARTRGDLAVILAASGHSDEAISLLERAVSVVERKRGDASAHLLPLFTNAAHLLARVAPDRAEPYVARLKALVFAQQQAENAELFPPTAVPVHSFDELPLSSGSDDHLLRAAIAETVDLLRSTPAANVAMQFQTQHNAPTDVGIDGDSFSDISVNEVVTAEIPVSDVVTPEFLFDEAVSAAMQSDDDASAAILTDEDADVTVAWEYEMPPSIVPPENGRAEAQATELDDTLFDLVEPPPPTLSELPKPAPKGAQSANPNPLGFQVEYGIPSQLHESFANPTAPLPTNPTGTAITDAEVVAPLQPSRSVMRAVGGVRRGSTQVVSMKRLWMIGASVAAFGGGIGAVLLYKYLRALAR
ncbi:MAG: tetratricopeptide repeat protein [Gemmatimonadaceae bacterium]